MAHVVGKIEMWVIDPHRSALAQWYERQPLAVPGHEMEPGLDCLKQLLVIGRGSLEYGARRHVHMGGAPLEVEEGGVQASQPVTVWHVG
jgi:hypothetical protein